LKIRPNGENTKYNARLVARGFLHKPGIDFNEVYAPLARIVIIRIIEAKTTYKGGRCIN